MSIFNIAVVTFLSSTPTGRSRRGRPNRRDRRIPRTIDAGDGLAACAIHRVNTLIAFVLDTANRFGLSIIDDDCGFINLLHNQLNCTLYRAVERLRRSYRRLKVSISSLNLIILWFFTGSSVYTH